MKTNTQTCKKIIYILLLFIAVSGVAWWYFSEEDQTPTSVKTTAETADFQMVTSGYVPYTLTREIAGPKAQITMLVPPGVEPHHFEPTPGSIIAVQNADVFIYVSQRIEPWVEDILQGLPNVNSVEAGPSLTDADPHVWMTPYGALAMAKRIEAALSKADPAHKKMYKQNLRRFEKQMQQLHTDFTTGLAHCKSRDLVHIGHLAFSALAATYDLQLQALSGVSHQGEHSVYKLTGMVRFVRHRKLTAVFTEEMVSPQLAQTVAKEAHVKILPLYTIEEISKEEFDRGVSYEEYMRRNLKNLQEGLQCPA